MADLLQVQTDRVEPDITVVTLAGKIVMGPDSMEVENLLARLLRQNEKKVVFDLSRVFYIDSSGLGVIANCFNKLQGAGGGLRIAGAAGKIRDLFRITRLDAVLPFFADVPEATRDFNV